MRQDQAPAIVSHPGALRQAATILEKSLRPPAPMRVSEWVGQNVILVDGPNAGKLWHPSGAPYMVEILDLLSDDHPCNLVTVRKSQQSGASIAALAWVLYCADREPANMIYAAPAIDALRKVNSAKLQPLIDAWQRKIGRKLIVDQVSRAGASSTTYEKVFAKTGRLFLANANSKTDLSSVTTKKGVKDEVSKWEMIPGAGNPEVLFFGRFTAFRGTGDWKILEISTPEADLGDETGENENHCRIDRSFKAGDQRYWHVACPACGVFFVHKFSQLRYDKAAPKRATYECESCQHQITEAERRIQLQPEAGAHWRATAEGEGRHPSFHIDAFISLMMGYGAIAEDYLATRGSGVSLQDFSKLVLGLPYKVLVDVPDYKRLLERREAHLRRGHIPHDALLLTAAADVQMRGIWLEIVAWTPDRRSYLVDAIYIGGDTDAHDAAVFQRLRAETIDRRFPDAFGGYRTIDALAVDSGYRANVVYSWSRLNQTPHPDTGRDLVLAIKGDKGWGKPPLGTPSLQDIDLGGKKLRQGAKVWAVGTWPLKSSLYLDLGKQRLGETAAEAPPGYCHFHGDADEEYFKQLCASHLEDIKVRGRPAGKRWVDLRENHFLDCRVYNMAMAEYLGLSVTTPDEWAALARHRGLPPEVTKRDLFTAPAEAVAAPEPKPEPAPPPVDDWLGGRGRNW
ncbi:phage terminase large subunit family protein [Bosea sp. LjRoot9]|uniref:terminase gpA endonuclease subunit n=1 Tax=Bosea sp. LjRoot9 TaxID=3342341 RepID=UPI003ECCB1D2